MVGVEGLAVVSTAVETFASAAIKAQLRTSKPRDSAAAHFFRNTLRRPMGIAPTR